MTIAELFASVVPRLENKPQCSIIEAVRRAQSIIVNRLLLKRSNLIKTIITASVSEGDEYVTLNPSNGQGFLSIAGEPYHTDRTYLKPFDSAVLAPSVPAKPRYYERLGRKAYLYPLPDAAYDISFPVYATPPVLTDMDEDLPFDGLFDDVISEAAYGIMLNGTSAVADKTFTAAIDSQVDMVLLAQDMADEQALADSINYH